jgi:hypothetical protein
VRERRMGLGRAWKHDPIPEGAMRVHTAGGCANVEPLLPSDHLTLCLALASCRKGAAVQRRRRGV